MVFVWYKITENQKNIYTIIFTINVKRTVFVIEVKQILFNFIGDKYLKKIIWNEFKMCSLTSFYDCLCKDCLCRTALARPLRQLSSNRRTTNGDREACVQTLCNASTVVLDWTHQRLRTIESIIMIVDTPNWPHFHLTISRRSFPYVATWTQNIISDNSRTIGTFRSFRKHLRKFV